MASLDLAPEQTSMLGQALFWRLSLSYLKCNLILNAVVFVTNGIPEAKLEMTRSRAHWPGSPGNA